MIDLFFDCFLLFYVFIVCLESVVVGLNIIFVVCYLSLGWIFVILVDVVVVVIVVCVSVVFGFYLLIFCVFFVFVWVMGNDFLRWFGYYNVIVGKIGIGFFIMGF